MQTTSQVGGNGTSQNNAELGRECRDGEEEVSETHGLCIVVARTSNRGKSGWVCLFLL